MELSLWVRIASSVGTVAGYGVKEPSFDSQEEDGSS
jgi:hypothetical protein